MNTAPTADRVVGLTNVSVSFNGRTAVENLSLSIDRGERVAVLGRTGAGKSTLMNLLVGNLRATRGQVRVSGMDPFVERKLLQGHIGMAFQAPRLLPWRTALGNVVVGLEILGKPPEGRRTIAEKWLNQVHLGHAGHLYPSQLSGGMRQRVSLARAFAIEPDLMLLDESFSALDEVTADSLRDEFLQLCRSTNMTALIVTHNIEEAFLLAERVIVLGRPARILREFQTSACPTPGTGEFLEFRQSIHTLIGSDSHASTASLIA
ncbi:Bicarbonate transport ATP-binding protein CmpD (plasmid) [Variovorax sp. SRS16]|uniref:ABC transporter ATP-binding protein n=1 Tax=Variovorax sp. SRS16 TaxID=282217 RepID=UPI001315F4B3|nr:ABC transporter ATP-binding protein [Variovorax sp. SRS16]VTU46470.1 Bicarbonate transport ATP-binding protein CmpD [Variovorax sp. SRS16]